MNERVEEECALLEKTYSSVTYVFQGNLHWFLIGEYLLPSEFSPNTIEITFNVTVGHPIPKPYGFFIPSGITYNNQVIVLKSPPSPPPFSGNWVFCSWDPVAWRPGTNIINGDNLFGWSRSFRKGIIECSNLHT